MTEMSPVGTVVHDEAGKHRDCRSRRRLAIKASRAGRMFGVELKIVDDEGRRAAAWDGATSGELLVRGPWIVVGLFQRRRGERRRARRRGLVRTGDMRDDRPGRLSCRSPTAAKDVIKSGGEWI